MRKIKRAAALLLAVLLVGAMSESALAADWPQFLGDPASRGVSAGDAATTGKDLALRWEKIGGGGADGMRGWSDMPGTPIVVGDYVYYYAAQNLHKVELKSGKEVASAPVYGAPMNQFFINIAYGEGKIFVPCQKDNLDDGVEIPGCFLRVYDANTLQQLYVTESLGSGQMQCPVIYHDGYFVTGTYARNSVYAGFTAEDEDAGRSNEIKSVSWKVDAPGEYVFTFNGAVFVGDYCYYGGANILYIVNYKTGAAKTVDIGKDHYISSSITYSAETGRLYVANKHVDGHAAVFSYTLGSDGMPKSGSVRKWISATKSGGTQSTPVVYKGRLYLGGGGYTMGSNEPFHVLDAETLREIYSVPVLSKGSAGISTAWATAENGWQVYIYMAPFAPNAQGQSELWIIKDQQGQTEADYEIVKNVGYPQYCSQSIIVASDGSLIWYNDGGRVYCYENTKGIFPDTKSHWGRADVAYLARRGILHGNTNGFFEPDGPITRAQFAQILANMSGEDFSGCSTDIYSDVSTQWYAPAVSWAALRGIADTGIGTYRPDEPITREDMSLMLYRYVTLVAETSLPTVNTPVDFTDAARIAPDAAEAVAIMQQGGIINGIADGAGFRFAPKEQATRAQASAMIARFYASLRG